MNITYVITCIIITSVIILICVIFYCCFSNKNNTYQYIESKEIYRIGDIFTVQAFDLPANLNKYSIDPKRIIQDYPNSIFAEYIKRTKMIENINNKLPIKKRDYNELIRILYDFKMIKFKDNDYIAIHIRLGDVLCFPPNDHAGAKGRRPLPCNELINKIHKLIQYNNLSNNYPLYAYTYYHIDHATKEWDWDEDTNSHLKNCITIKSDNYINKLKN